MRGRKGVGVFVFVMSLILLASNVTASSNDTGKKTYMVEADNTVKKTDITTAKAIGIIVTGKTAINKTVKTVNITESAYIINTTGSPYDMSDYDFTEIDEIISDTGYEGESFSDMVDKLMSGDSEGIFLELFNMAGDKLFGEIGYNKDAIVKVVLIAIAAAMLSKLSAIFMNNKMSDMGFFSVYTLLMVVLMSAFSVNMTVATDIMELLIGFMKCLIPAFFLAVGASTGMTASMGLYEIALVSIMAVEYIILNFVIPAISVYVVILLLNNILDEDYLSKFASVVETIISWVIKIIPTVALAINLIGSIVLPSVDYTKAKGYRKIFGLIPGIGQGVDTFVDIVAGSGALIKNAIGGAALVCIIVLVAVPVIKLVVFCFMYKITAAVVQPVSDKRVTSSVEVMAKGANLLYRAILTCALLFFLTIAIVCLGTGRG